MYEDQKANILSLTTLRTTLNMLIIIITILFYLLNGKVRKLIKIYNTYGKCSNTLVYYEIKCVSLITKS